MSDVFKAVGAYVTGKEDARALRRQGDVAANQAFADEAALRGESAQFLGRQAAAFAEAGVGDGGTAAYLMNQSNVAANLDALNVRYKGVAKRTELYGEAAMAKRRAKQKAAGHLIKGMEKIASGGVG